MKKVLALALVAVLALGMGMGVFAKTDSKGVVTGFETGTTLMNGITKTSGLDMNYTGQTVGMGDVKVQDEPGIDINLLAGEMFGVTNAGGNTTAGTQYVYAIAMGEFKKIALEAGYWTTAAQTNPAVAALNGAANLAAVEAALAANQTFIDLKQAAILAGGVEYLNAGGTAGTGTTIPTNTLVKPSAAAKTVADALAAIGGASVNSVATAADAEYLVSALGSSYLVPVKLTDATSGLTYLQAAGNRFVATANDGSTVTGRNLTAAEIRSAKIKVGYTAKGGSKVIKKCDLSTKDGRIEFRIVTELVSTTDYDFECIVYVTIDGKRQNDEEITITGNVANLETEVYADYDYVDTSKGYVAVAEDFVSKIEVDLGNGVSIFTKFFKGKKYYGTSTRDADEADDVVFSKYPDVDNVVTLKTVGLNSTGDIVKLDTDYAGYFVYDSNMKYLGKATEMLPYSTKYYLANRQLNVVDETEAEEETEVEPEDGDAGEVEGNANANPGTGR